MVKGFYRPDREVNAAVTSSSQFFACTLPEACILANASTTCASGYSGPLCGVCQAGYALFGKVCSRCWPSWMSRGVIVLIAFIILGAIIFLARRRSSGIRTLQSSIFRIMTSFIQAVGSLRAFKVGSSALYDSAFGWSEAVSASPLSLGPVQCQFPLRYLEHLASLTALPFLIAAGVMVVLVIMQASAATHCRTRLTFRRKDFTAGLRQVVADGRPTAALLSVATFAYMPIISASLRGLNCTPSIDGARFLYADMSTPCDFRTRHIMLILLSVTVILVYGLGFPCIVVWKLRNITVAQLRDVTFRQRWGSLFDGYRIVPVDGETIKSPEDIKKSTTLKSAALADASASKTHACSRTCSLSSRNIAFFEAAVLSRKMGIALISLLIVDMQLQLVAANAWVTCFLALQLFMQPYENVKLNMLESIALVALLCTTVLSTLLVPNTGDAEAYDLATRQLGVAITLIIINGCVFIYLLYCFIVARLRPATAKLSGAFMGPRRTLAFFYKRKVLTTGPIAQRAAPATTSIASSASNSSIPDEPTAADDDHEDDMRMTISPIPRPQSLAMEPTPRRPIKALRAIVLVAPRLARRAAQDTSTISPLAVAAAEKAASTATAPALAATAGGVAGGRAATRSAPAKALAAERHAGRVNRPVFAPGRVRRGDAATGKRQPAADV